MSLNTENVATLRWVMDAYRIIGLPGEGLGHSQSFKAMKGAFIAECEERGLALFLEGTDGAGRPMLIASKKF